VVILNGKVLTTWNSFKRLAAKGSECGGCRMIFHTSSLTDYITLKFACNSCEDSIINYDNTLHKKLCEGVVWILQLFK